jgi:hypothetical protein
MNRTMDQMYDAEKIKLDTEQLLRHVDEFLAQQSPSPESLKKE